MNWHCRCRSFGQNRRTLAQVRTPIDSLDSHDANGEGASSRRDRKRTDETFASYRVQSPDGFKSDMDHTLNGEMARTNLGSLCANLEANLDGAEQLNQIRTNIDDHARIMKQLELSTGARSSEIKFVRILIHVARILTPYRHQH